MDKNTTPQSEEIDLGKLFTMIGNGFKKMFNGIANIFKAIFHNIILILIFFKKHAIKFAIAIVIGGLIGYFLDTDKKPKYKSTMLVETNFGSGHQLYSQLEYINSLIEQNDSITLGKIFNVPLGKIAALKRIAIEPYEPEKNIMLEYDYYIQNTDTIYTFAQDFTIKDFQARMSDPDYRLQEVTAVSSELGSFSKLKEGIISLVENDYFKNKFEIKNKELQEKKIILEKDLKQIDSLRVLYKNVALLEAQKEHAPSTNIDLSDKGKLQNTDLDLFKERRFLLNQLKKLNKNIVRSDFIIKAVSDFTKGEEISSIRSKKWFLGSVVSFLMVLFFILGLKLNKYLSTYNKL